jgi:predicted Zn-dependent protease with MMP-like domain
LALEFETCVPAMSFATEWQQWLGRAEGEVASILRSLPPALRDEAQAVTVSYERKPTPELINEGIEEDTLGLFVGSAFPEGVHSAPFPQQIILYLENIWEAAEDDPEIFDEEVRATFLHELGHYLGLDEDDLIDRGLE